MSRRRRRLEEEEGIVEVPQQGELNSHYIVEVVFNDERFTQAKADAALNAAVAELEG